MARYEAGPSVLWIDGGRVEPGRVFEHDFSLAGPDGAHGPAREAALLAAGAVRRLDPVVEVAASVPPPQPVQTPPMAPTPPAPPPGARGVTADDHE